ncbi:hypothetical protein HYFRA_00000912 [Hymenoscyphus fraxineus]|uniref:Uncharacterized protein n=1 Tax=Hymenoscyphus fraxineus TaxID=746836 RepID=A0A9N9KSH7_9HELO|nr:hypothetical protein HYFRA_00000912 [Hymenoscyphus fraxineus]
MDPTPPAEQACPPAHLPRGAEYRTVVSEPHHESGGSSDWPIATALCWGPLGVSVSSPVIVGTEHGGKRGHTRLSVLDELEDLAGDPVPCTGEASTRFEVWERMVEPDLHTLYTLHTPIRRKLRPGGNLGARRGSEPERAMHVEMFVSDDGSRDDEVISRSTPLVSIAPVPSGRLQSASVKRKRILKLKLKLKLRPRPPPTLKSLVTDESTAVERQFPARRFSYGACTYCAVLRCSSLECALVLLSRGTRAKLPTNTHHPSPITQHHRTRALVPGVSQQPVHALHGTQPIDHPQTFAISSSSPIAGPVPVATSTITSAIGPQHHPVILHCCGKDSCWIRFIATRDSRILASQVLHDYMQGQRITLVKAKFNDRTSQAVDNYWGKPRQLSG